MGRKMLTNHRFLLFEKQKQKRKTRTVAEKVEPIT